MLLFYILPFPQVTLQALMTLRNQKLIIVFERFLLWNQKQCLISVKLIPNFRDEAAKYIEEDIGTAVDDRRHNTVTHLAKAISIRDFRDQVKSRLPKHTLVPGEEWIRLQFWPKSKRTRTGLRHT